MPTLDEADRHHFEVAFRSPDVGGRVFDALRPVEDGQVAIPLLRGLSEDATIVWTPAISSAGVRTLARAAVATAGGIWFEIPMLSRTSASKGAKFRGVKLAYLVATATPTDIRCELYKRTIPATGNAPATPSLMAGATNSEYDTAHNTEAERVAQASHTLLVTVPAAAQDYVAADEELLVRVYVDPTAGTTSVVPIKDLVLLTTPAL